MGIIFNTGRGKLFFGILLCMGCVKDQKFENLGQSCDTEWVANTTFAELTSLYLDGTVQILEDLVIAGYVISSDEAGNFYGTIHFQDAPINPSSGLQMAIDLQDSHLFYPIGSKILINLKGLYLGQSKGVFKLGGVFTSFGTETIGPLPKVLVSEHIKVSCEPQSTIVPSLLLADDVTEDRVNTLVSLQDVEILEEELGLPFSVSEEETKRTLIDCSDNTIILLNSGYADFQSESMPEGRGTVTGVILWEKGEFQLVVRGLADIDLREERCADLVDEFTSDELFISELADPDNNAKARFVELYNSGSAALSLKGWQLRRYTNANTQPSSTIDLSGYTMEGESTFIVSPNATEFELVYGFVPDLGVGTNTAADSNGDDTIELIDPFGTIIDKFGRVGEDGTGTDHEFEDGRAVRNPEISKGNSVYNAMEWTLFNDSGEAGTIKLPQNAPEDFSPGSRN